MATFLHIPTQYICNRVKKASLVTFILYMTVLFPIQGRRGRGGDSMNHFCIMRILDF